MKAFFLDVSADLSPYDEGRWGLTIEFGDNGYVSDDVAADDDSLLKTMWSDAVAESRWREENGHGALELVGWAAPLATMLSRGNCIGPSIHGLATPTPSITLSAHLVAAVS